MHQKNTLAHGPWTGITRVVGVSTGCPGWIWGVLRASSVPAHRLSAPPSFAQWLGRGQLLIFSALALPTPFSV